ncbi:hypothetical protein KY338_00610 [Candidatus Woesearchaeota archaeon]|nr:hypothetical protein [Candidatus Woesearchaeota archaeon]MBW3005179.1 hypothetical protein [Candidatus Woesearchaeota archaeon]
MEFKKLIQEIESTKEFKDWKEKHPDFYLVHAFVMKDQSNQEVWQIGYYDKNTNKMEIIVKQGDKIEFAPAQEILKASQEILPLDPDEVKIDYNKAIEIALDCIKENYPKEPILKNFFIIQHLEGATIYNITYVAQTFKTINVKVSSTDGKIIKHSCEKLADFK